MVYDGPESALMSALMPTLCGAAYGSRSPERVNSHSSTPTAAVRKTLRRMTANGGV